jgi:hypothetical protein
MASVGCTIHACLFISHIIMISFNHVNNDHKMFKMRFELMLDGFLLFKEPLGLVVKKFY